MPVNDLGSDSCYHCGLPVIPGSSFQANILGKIRAMCCPGCEAVAEAIVSNGLEDYYRFRTEKAIKGDELLDETLSKLDAYDHPDIQQEFVSQDGNNVQIQLTVEGISCAACGWLIEKQLIKLKGIQRVAVNVSSRRATISWSESELKLSKIILQIEKIGYHALPFQQDEHEASFQSESQKYLRRLGLAGLMTMQVMMLAIGLYFGLFGYIEEQTEQYFHWVSLILTTPVVIYSGAGFYQSAINALRNRTVNMDVSVSLAILGTFVSSGWATITDSGQIYFESVCMFVFLLLISRYVEQRSRHKASQLSANMIKYIPLTATLIEGNETHECLAKHLAIGQHVLVKPGETIPVDATISQGSGKIDESMLTGESKSIFKQSGDNVFGGTINQNNVLTLAVTRPLKDALVNQILRLQEVALSEKPKAAVFADHASRYFVVLVLAIACVSYLVWLSIDPTRAFWVAIAVLVATCPCALSLATPTAITAGLAKLNEFGLLVKRADVLEIVEDIDTIIFDKTGTLTDGHFSLVEIRTFAQFDKKLALSIAASIEQYSQHPIAKAFLSVPDRILVSSVETITGKGLSAIFDGKVCRIGSANYMDFSIPDSEQNEGFNVYLQVGDQVVAGFSIEDALNSEAEFLISKLAAYNLHIVSGDSQNNVEAVAKQLAVTSFKFGQSPEQKLSYIKQLQQQGHRVLMVGDGINDAPILAKADVSIAVGNAADMAKRSADIILLGNKMSSISLLFSVSAKIRQKVKQNMAWAIGYNLLILPLAVLGVLSPWMAVIGMSLSSIIVVVNSVRLLR